MPPRQPPRKGICPRSSDGQSAGLLSRAGGFESRRGHPSDTDGFALGLPMLKPMVLTMERHGKARGRKQPAAGGSTGGRMTCNRIPPWRRGRAAARTSTTTRSRSRRSRARSAGTSARCRSGSRTGGPCSGNGSRRTRGRCARSSSRPSRSMRAACACRRSTSSRSSATRARRGLTGVPFVDGEGAEHTYKINNSDSSLLARWLLGRHPGMRIELRESMFDEEEKHEA